MKLKIAIEIIKFVAWLLARRAEKYAIRDLGRMSPEERRELEAYARVDVEATQALFGQEKCLETGERSTSACYTASACGCKVIYHG